MHKCFPNTCSSEQQEWKKQRKKTIQAEKSEKWTEVKWHEIKKAQTIHMGPLIPEAADELPNEPNLHQ